LLDYPLFPFLLLVIVLECLIPGIFNFSLLRA